MEEPNREMMKTRLLGYQKEGLYFMKSRERNPIYKCGMILDEPGLGKTIQMLSLIVDDLSLNNLVVCSTSLIDVWLNEIKTHTNIRGDQVFVYHGTKRIDKLKKASENTRIYLTSYHIVGNELEIVKNLDGSQTYIWKEGSLFRRYFDRIVVDEAHNLKNKETKNSKAVRKLRSKRKWVITATPIHNNMDEYYFYLNFFERYDSFKDYRSVIKKNRSGVEELRKELSRISIRRKKENVLKLPEKFSYTVKLEFSEYEKEFYNALLTYSEERIRALVERFNANKRMNQGSVTSNGLSSVLFTNILTFILRLRQACCHPEMVYKKMQRLRDAHDMRTATRVLLEHTSDFCKKKVKEYKSNGLDECSICMDQDATYISAGVDIKNSGNCNCGFTACKTCWDRLLKKRRVCPNCRGYVQDIILIQANKEKPKKVVIKKPPKIESVKIDTLMNEIKNTETKLIVGSQWVEYLKIIKRRFVKEFPGEKYIMLSGDTCATKRPELIRKFRTEPEYKVMFVSSSAASEGFTAIEAKKVILMEHWWNNARDLQLGDRIHRIGQDTNVHVIKYMIKDTIEDKMMNLIDKKTMTIDAILEGKNIENVEEWMDRVIMLIERRQE